MFEENLKDYLINKIDLLETLIDQKQNFIDFELGESYKGSKPYYKAIRDIKNLRAELAEARTMLGIYVKEIKDLTSDASKVQTADIVFSNAKYNICYSNYRCVLVPIHSGEVVGAFWTPELLEKEGVENSHHRLLNYLYSKHRDITGVHSLVDGYMWAGFYTYGVGNYDQKSLNLYGESTDYPHKKYSRGVKDCFVNNLNFFNWMTLEEEYPF